MNSIIQEEMELQHSVNLDVVKMDFIEAKTISWQNCSPALIPCMRLLISPEWDLPTSCWSSLNRRKLYLAVLRLFPIRCRKSWHINVKNDSFKKLPSITQSPISLYPIGCRFDFYCCNYTR